LIKDHRLIIECAHHKPLTQECEICQQVAKIEDSLRVGLADQPVPYKRIDIFYYEDTLNEGEEIKVSYSTIWLHIDNKWYKVRSTNNVEDLIKQLLSVFNTISVQVNTW